MGVLGEGLARPQLQGDLEVGEGRRRPAGRKVGLPGLHLGAEDLGVDHAGRAPRKRVAPRSREQEGGVAERPAGEVDEHPEIRCGIRRRAQRPEGLREGVAGDEAPPVDRQHLDEAAGQALAERGRGDLLSSPPGREAPQQPNLDEHVSPLRSFRPTTFGK